MSNPIRNQVPPLPFTDSQVRKGLWLSIFASSLGVLHYGLLAPTSLLAVGFMLALDVDKFWIAVLSATLPLSRVMEIVGSYLTHRTGRRRQIFAWPLISSRMLWVGIVLVPLLLGSQWTFDAAKGTAVLLPTLFALLLTSSLLTWIGANAWLSWMGDLIPEQIRGRYFGVRQVCEVVVSTAGMLLVGWYMGEHPIYGQYVVVFCILVFFGVADVLLFLRVPHPEVTVSRDEGEIRRMFLLPFRDRRYRQLMLFLGTWMFGSGLLHPYMWVFIKSNDYLGLTYMFGAVSMAIGGSCRAGTSYVWGLLGDHWSARKALLLCVLVSVTPPFYYLFATPTSKLPIYLAWAIGSVAWSGIIVLAFRYTIALAPPRQRSMYLACYSAMMGLVGTAAYLCAGGLVLLLNGIEIPVGPWVWGDLQVLFCIAGVLRGLSLIPLFRMDRDTGE